MLIQHGKKLLSTLEPSFKSTIYLGDWRAQKLERTPHSLLGLPGANEHPDERGEREVKY